jgi:molybdopterin converting factor small subunit
MIVRVEFFGVPRQRVGLAAMELQLADAISTLGAAWLELGRRFPEFAAACLEHDRLKPQYICNLGGHRFVSDPRIALSDGDILLVMSADAGG